MRRWLVAALVVLLAVGLLAFARGREQRRGDEVGVHAAAALIATPVRAPAAARPST